MGRQRTMIGLSAALVAACASLSIDAIGRAAVPVGADGALRIDIASPADGSRHPWRGQVGYEVAAVYRGKSTKFGELQPNDVVVETRFLPDVAAAPRIARALPDVLVTISQSNCAGCHDFNASAAGPSFAAIGTRYAHQPAAAAALALHIRNGSKGAWGAAAMPPHPDLSPAQARAVADWIVAHGDDPATRYHVGTTGSFRMVPVGKLGPRAGTLVTAFYTGPLGPGDSRRPVAGRDRVVVLGTPGS